MAQAQTRATTEPPPTRGHKKKERTRRQLITAAVHVIARQGEAFTVAEITEEAGVSHGTFYNYFDDREALIDAVVPDLLVRFADESALAVDGDDPVDRFATITARALHLAAAAPNEVRVLLRLDAVHRAIVESTAVDELRADIAAGAAAQRFCVEPDDATLDVVVGSLIFAARRVVEGSVGDDYPVAVVAQLLRSLGVADADARARATEATARARALPADRPLRDRREAGRRAAG